MMVSVFAMGLVLVLIVAEMIFADCVEGCRGHDDDHYRRHGKSENADLGRLVGDCEDVSWRLS